MKRTSIINKLVLCVFLILFCPFVMGAVTASQNHAALQVGSSTASSDNQALTFNNQMFGIHGPFSLQATYSKLFGLTFEGIYTQLIGNRDAASAELDLGGKQRRVSATWGHALTSNQLVKLTAENLSQKLDFDFSSGTVSQWIYQNAIGASYAYLLGKDVLHDVNFNAYYSKANSKTLANKNYTQGGILYRNYRRIAGGTNKSLSAGVDVTPLPTTLVGVQANYDNVSYRMRNDLSAKRDDNGLGATVSLDQLINDHVKFRLLASHRKPYQDYQAGINWLVYSVPGSNLQLGLLGERIVGNLGTRNDNQVGINLTYNWGGDQSAKPYAYGSSQANIGINNLRDWVSVPSVRMEQVLALVDQSSERLPSPVPSPSDKSSAVQHVIIVHPKEIKQVDVTQYFAAQVKDKDADKIQYTIKNLPKNHDLQYKDGKLMINSDSFTAKDNNKNFAIDFVSANVNSISSLNVMSLVIAVKPNDGDAPYPNPDYMPGGTPGPITLNWNAGTPYADVNPIDPQIQTTDHQLIINPHRFIKGNELHFSLVDKDNLGIKCRQENIPWPDKPGAFYYHVYLSTDGPLPDKPGDHEIDLYASNHGGTSAPLSITIHIPSGHNPTITIPKPWPDYHEGDTVPETTFATACAGKGEKFADKNSITVEAIDTKGHKYPMDHFGLETTVMPKKGEPVKDFTDADIKIQTIEGKTVQSHADSPQDYEITATNERPLSTTKDFTLTVERKINTPVVTPTKTSLEADEGKTLNKTDIATVCAGDGEKFADTDHIKVEAIDSQNHKFDLDHFGMEAVVTPDGKSNDFTNATVAILSEKGQTAKNPADSPQKYQVEATNEDDKTGVSPPDEELTFTVHPAVVRLYARCPDILHDPSYQDEHGVWHYKVTEYVKGNARLYTYDYAAKRSQVLPKPGSYLEKAYYTKGYPPSVPPQVICTYNLPDGNSIAFYAIDVPHEKDATNVAFTNPSGDKYHCKGSGKEDWCEFHYDLPPSAHR